MAKAEQTCATPSTELMQAFPRAKCQSNLSVLSKHFGTSRGPRQEVETFSCFAQEWRVNCVEPNQVLTSSIALRAVEYARPTSVHREVDEPISRSEDLWDRADL